jgi:hypothetical protein
MIAGPVSANVVTFFDPTISSTNFQIALNGTSDNDIIVLNPGTYYVHDILVVRDNLTFESNQTIAGGGNTQNTILDGTGSSNGILYNVSTSLGDNVNYITVKYLTLQNGHSGNSDGGGAINSYANTTVISSDFYRDTTSAKGGAISIHSNGWNLTVMGSNFTWCSAVSGGGALAHDQDSSPADPSFISVNTSSFVNCYSSGNSGGAIHTKANGNISFNRFDNTTAASTPTILDVNGGGGFVDARFNWWGTNDATALPSRIKATNAETVTYTPYLTFGVTATPQTIPLSQTSTIQADFSFDSTGNQPSPNLLPDGIPVFFTIWSGPGSIPSASVPTSGHVASATLTPSGPGAGTIRVNASTSSGYNESVLVTVLAAPVPVVTTVTPIPSAPPSDDGGGGGGGGIDIHPGKPSSVIVQHVDQPAANPPLKQPGAFDTPVTPSRTPVPVVPVVTPVLHQPTILDMILPAIQEYQFWLILIIILIIVVAILRRWWIRRQNPSLFRKYD